MAFNPTLPVENTELDAAQMRDQFNGLKALIDAQATQITELSNQNTAQQSQLDAQAAQIAELHSLLFLSAPEVSSNKDGTGSARVTKSQLAIAPDAWEFITSMASSPDPNLDLTGCTSLGVLMGSDDDGDCWSKPVINTTSNVMLAARYRIKGLWSPYSIWVLSEL